MKGEWEGKQKLAVSHLACPRDVFVATPVETERKEKLPVASF